MAGDELGKEIRGEFFNRVATWLFGGVGGIATFLSGAVFTEFEMPYWLTTHWEYTVIGFIIGTIQVLCLLRFKVSKAIASLLVSAVLIGAYSYLDRQQDSEIWQYISVREKYLLYISWLCQFAGLIGVLVGHGAFWILKYGSPKSAV